MKYALKLLCDIILLITVYTIVKLLFYMIFLLLNYRLVCIIFFYLIFLNVQKN